MCNRSNLLYKMPLSPRKLTMLLISFFFGMCTPFSIKRYFQNQSFSECVALQDPYCTWVDSRCANYKIGIQSIETGTHPSCPRSYTSMLPTGNTLESHMSNVISTINLGNFNAQQQKFPTGYLEISIHDWRFQFSIWNFPFFNGNFQMTWKLPFKTVAVKLFIPSRNLL